METETSKRPSATVQHTLYSLPIVEKAQASHDLTLTMVTGDNALQLLRDALFIASWDTLYTACPWHSVYQHKSFVLSWYKHYAGSYLPIVVQATFGEKLVGLLTLARSQADKVIQVAGFRDAHYQVWLAEPGFGNSFMQEAIKLLYQEYPQDEVNFYNTPPQTPLEWLQELPTWRYPHTLRSFVRPLMKLDEPGYASATLNSKRFRKRLNQLKKMGDVQFEQITCERRFEAALEEMAAQFDFRKAAKYNWTEFESDPLKKPLLLDLFREGILYVSVLQLNGKIIASLIDTIGSENWMHGSEISTYSCFHARHSPGILCFMLLGQHLASVGYTVYDLTPGSDDYKARLANAHDHVHELRFTPSVKALLVRKSEIRLRALAGNLLKRSRLNPKKVFDNIQRLTYKVKSINTYFHTPHSPAIPGLVRKTHALHPVKVQAIPSRGTKLLRKESLQDLLHYAPRNTDVPRWDFLAEAMHLIENGCVPYTFSIGSELKFCCWHVSPSIAADLYPGFAPHTEVLYGAYHQELPVAKVTELLQETAQQIVITPDQEVIILLSDNNLVQNVNNLCYK